METQAGDPDLAFSEILEVLWRQSPSAYGNNGKVHYREEGKNGTVNYELAEDVPGERMTPRILDTDLGYSGKWAYVFAQ